MNPHVTAAIAILGALLGVVNTVITLLRFCQERGALTLVVLKALIRGNEIDEWQIKSVKEQAMTWDEEKQSKWAAELVRLDQSVGESYERFIDLEFVLKNDFPTQTVISAITVDFLPTPQAPWRTEVYISDPVSGQYADLSRPVVLGPNESVSRKIEQYEAALGATPIELLSSPLYSLEEAVLTIITDRKTLTRHIHFDKDFLAYKFLPEWVRPCGFPE